jgi:hypothetical protein
MLGRLTVVQPVALKLAHHDAFSSRVRIAQTARRWRRQSIASRHEPTGVTGTVAIKPVRMAPSHLPTTWTCNATGHSQRVPALHWSCLRCPGAAVMTVTRPVERGDDAGRGGHNFLAFGPGGD